MGVTPKTKVGGKLVGECIGARKMQDVKMSDQLARRKMQDIVKSLKSLSPYSQLIYKYTLQESAYRRSRTCSSNSSDTGTRESAPQLRCGCDGNFFPQICLTCSRLTTWSVIFTSYVFMSCNFQCPAFLRPVFSVNPMPPPRQHARTHAQTDGQREHIMLQSHIGRAKAKNFMVHYDDRTTAEYYLRVTA